MTLHTPLYMEDDSYSATDDRGLISAVWATQGVIGLGDLAVSQHAAGANMSVDVAAGFAVILGNDISGQHKYVCVSDAVFNVTPIAAAPGAGLSRISIIVAKVRDADQAGGAFSDWIIEEIAGTAATTGTQVAPTLPASCLALQSFTVASGVTSITTGILNAGTDMRVPSGMTNPLVGVPRARMYPTLGSTFANNTPTNVGNMTQDYAKNGLTVVGNTIVLPAYAATWTISAMVTWSSAITSGNVLTFVRSNSSLLRTYTAQAGANGFPGAGGSDDFDLPASAVIDMQAEQNVGAGGENNQAGSANTWLSVRLAGR